MLKRPLTRIPLLLALLLTAWTTAQNAPRPLAQLAPAESFLLLGQNPSEAPETGLQTDLEDLDFPRAGRTLEHLAELSDDPSLRPLLEQYSDLFQGAEGRSKRQQKRLRDQTGPGAGFFRCLEANTPENPEDLTMPEGEYSALLSVGASSYSPIPAATAMLRVTPEAAAELTKFQNLLVRCTEQVGLEVARLKEGNTTLFVIGNAGDFPVIISQVGTLFVAGTNPEAVRGVVRRAHGSAEPNLSETDFYRQNRVLLGGPGVSLALDAAALGGTLESLAGSFVDASTEPLLTKLVGSLRTLGSYAGAVYFEGQELRLTSHLSVNPEGGDTELATLLLNDTPAPAPTLAPDGSTALSTAHIEPQAVLDYLEGWADLAGRAMGESISLQELAQQELGLNLDTALGWLGDEVTNIVLEPIGTDINTLLYGQAQVMALQTTGETATEAGLAEIGGAVLRGLESQDFSDTEFPEFSTQVAESTYRYGDTEITRFRVGPTFDFGTAFLGDTLLVGTPAAALEDVIATAEGYRRSLANDESFVQNQTDAPQNVVGLNYHDLSAELDGYAELTRVVAQPLAFAASVFVSEEADEAELPFADLLHAAELIPNSLEVLSNHTDTLTGYTWIEDGARHSETRLNLK